jgi:serine/threonine protein kinase
MRHERASVKADIWSYGILIWELISGKDITEYQPLAISRQNGPRPTGKVMTLPPDCPTVVIKVFQQCTSMEPEDRPTSQDIVEWLRES